MTEPQHNAESQADKPIRIVDGRTLMLYVGVIAAGDGPNEPATEIVGIYSTEELALEAARKRGPRTAEAQGFALDR